MPRLIGPVRPSVHRWHLAASSRLVRGIHELPDGFTLTHITGYVQPKAGCPQRCFHDLVSPGPATDPHHITTNYRLDDAHIELRYALGDDARVRSVALDRWGDPDSTGTWGAFTPFGFEPTGYSTFDGVVVPSAGRAGRFYGTDQWNEGDSR